MLNVLNVKCMKVSDFISHSLFDPQSGYYRTKNPIGKNSDFITAPEISQTFGELTSAYLLQIFSVKKTRFSLVEMGAGKGTWMRDILITIKNLADKKIPQAVDFLERAEIHIIEINEVLQKIQKENLKDFTIFWHENFEEFLTEQKGEICFISNELFDCFEIDQYVKTDIGWCERLIDSNRFVTAKFNPEIHRFVEDQIGFLASENAPINAVFEYSLTAKNFMEQLCKALKAQGGAAIIIDYGYVENIFANTLQAIKNHRKINVLEATREADITALVDFSMLQKITKNFELNSSLISQREFLMTLGIEERRAQLVKNNLAKKAEINSAIDRLIDSGQMGELFKCLIIWTPS
jgi:NADH dehydrogenase [ubiquinone] 1 alpha subcomplex assembly factor 7